VGAPAVHLRSASAATARRVLLQHAVAKKAKEMTAIPKLVSLLDLQGAVVSLEAMGCQQTIAEQIVKAEADYRVALKANPPLK
jgi:predicted transposase YbfD/YdcC